MKAMLSIRPEFVKKIMAGQKRFEFRKVLFRQPVSSVVVYATQPYGKVVGEFKIKNILRDNPDVVWKITQKSAGVTKNFFDKYYENTELAVAIEIEKFSKYEKPLSLQEFDSEIKTAPQSFCYLG